MFINVLFVSGKISFIFFCHIFLYMFECSRYAIHTISMATTPPTPATPREYEPGSLDSTGS